MTPSEARLAKLADLVADRAGAKLAALLREIAALQEQIHRLRDPASAEPGGTVYLQVGGDRLWREWRLAEIARLNADLARLRMREPAMRDEAGRATVRARLIPEILQRGRS